MWIAELTMYLTVHFITVCVAALLQSAVVVLYRFSTVDVVLLCHCWHDTDSMVL